MPVNNIRLSFILIILWCSFGTAQSQPTENKQFNGPIEEQLDVLVKNSFPYENFKDIRPNLGTLRRNILDSLSQSANQLRERDQSIQQQELKIDSLENSLSVAKKEASRRDLTSFLGMEMATATYHLFLWGLIILLAILLFYFMQRYKSNIQIAKDSRASEEEIREQFEQHRKKAMEREQKLKRDLQDELNKSSR